MHKSWIGRKKLNDLGGIQSPENEGRHGAWRVNASNNVLRNDGPSKVVQSEEYMLHAIQRLFPINPRHLGFSRHGGIFEVNGRIGELAQFLRGYDAAFVSGVVPYGATQRALLKVTRFDPSHLSWDQWLRYRIREARMHTAVYRKLQAQGSSHCHFVAPMYFAGVDMTTGMYYVVMQPPPGKLTTLAVMLKANKFSMRAYRAIEAAVGSIWGVGAMLTDTSAGNVLMSSKGFASIIDFDSSIVIPSAQRHELMAELARTWAAKKRGACGHILRSTVPDLINSWDYAMRGADDKALLKRLTVNVYGRNSWFPDISMLRVLFPMAMARKGSASRRGSLLKPLKSFFSPLRREGNITLSFPKVKVRRIGAVPDEVKKEWRPRKRGRDRNDEPRSSSSLAARLAAMRTRANNNNNNNTSRVIRRRRANNNNENTIPIPHRAAAQSTPSAPVVPSAPMGPTMDPGIAGIVAPMSGAFARGNNLGNKNAAQQVTYSPPTNDDFKRFPDLPPSHQDFIVDFEVKRLESQPTGMFVEFRKKLLGEKRQGSRVLNAYLEKENPSGWKAASPASKANHRAQEVGAVATGILRGVVSMVLERRPLDQRSRESQYRQGLDDSFKQGWRNYFMSFIRR